MVPRAWGRTGKNLDMGRACVRFTKLENVALDVIGEAIRRIPAKVYVERYRETLAGKTRKTGKVAKKTTKRASKKN